MKKILFAALILASSFTVKAADEPNEKVLTAFTKTFKNVQDVIWSELSDRYEVKFKLDEIATKVTYDKEGRIVRTLRYYGEDRLPILVLSALHDRFTDKKVYGVVEETSEEGTYYHITLETPKNWIEVKSDTYGTLTVEKKFKKA
jgi:hypothetical protein